MTYEQALRELAKQEELKLPGVYYELRRDTDDGTDTGGFWSIQTRFF